MTGHIVITGAAGRIGSALRPRLSTPGRRITLVDIREPDPQPGPDERVVVTDLRDRGVLDDAFAGADLIVHLAGFASERSFEEIASVNIAGTLAVFEAAHAAGVPRVLFASSVHAAGFDPVDRAALTPRPDSFYGVGKVAGEAIASLFADRFGMTAVSARIANFAPEPNSIRGLSIWFSPDDAARLVEAVAVLDRPGHHLVWGVSRNTRGVLDLSPGHAIGFDPVDDAEAFADRVSADTEEATDLLGAAFTVRELGSRD